MASQLFRIYCDSFHLEVTIGEKGDSAAYVFHAMPVYCGVGGDKLRLTEIQQLRNFCDLVENAWPKQKLLSKEKENE